MIHCRDSRIAYRPGSGSAAPQPPPRQQYLELKASVHRKLLNRLNLEALAQSDRAARRERDPHAARRAARRGRRRRSASASAKRCSASSSTTCSGWGRSSRCCAIRSISDILVNTYKHVFVERGGMLERVSANFQDDRHLHARHRSHRQRGRPARRRQLADGRRAPAGRLARQRDHPAARGRRPAAVDSPFSGRAAQGRRPGHAARADAADARFPVALRQGAAQRPHQRRHRRRQDDAAERAVQLHLASASASSRSKTRPNCSCTRSTSRGSRRVRPTSRARAPSGSGSSWSTPCVCAPIASSSARSAAKKRSTCCRR